MAHEKMHSLVSQYAEAKKKVARIEEILKEFAANSEDLETIGDCRVPSQLMTEDEIRETVECELECEWSIPEWVEIDMETTVSNYAEALYYIEIGGKTYYYK